MRRIMACIYMIPCVNGPAPDRHQRGRPTSRGSTVERGVGGRRREEGTQPIPGRGTFSRGMRDGGPSRPPVFEGLEAPAWRGALTCFARVLTAFAPPPQKKRKKAEAKPQASPAAVAKPKGKEKKDPKPKPRGKPPKSPAQQDPEEPEGGGGASSSRRKAGGGAAFAERLRQAD